MIPADIRILEAKDLFVSQARLTGESEPIEKTPDICKVKDSMDNKTMLCDELTGALISLARAADNNVETNADTWRIMIEGLCAAADANPGEEALRKMIDQGHTEKARLVPDCAVCTAPCGRTADYDMAQLQSAPEDIRRIKCDILSSVRCMALRARHTLTPDGVSGEEERLFALALFAVDEDWSRKKLLSVAAEINGKKRRFMK